MQPNLMSAIRDRRQISFTFHGYQRVAEPFRYGVNDKREERLSAFQLQGKPGDRPGWRFYSVNDIQLLQTRSENFDGKRPDYKAHDARFSQVYAEV
jgi:hypothetical protein